jgi:hypothetical protein
LNILEAEFTKYYASDKIKKTEMGMTYSTHEGEESCIQGSGGETPREGDHLEDPSVDGSIILKWIFEKWVERAWTGSIWLRIDTGGGLL